MKTLINKIIKLAMLSFLLLNAACTNHPAAKMTDYSYAPQSRAISVTSVNDLEAF